MSDIVISLGVDDQPPLVVRSQALAERRMAEAKKSFARRLASKFFRRKKVDAARAKTARKGVRAASKSARAAGSAARGIAGAGRFAAVLNPVTITIAALAAIAVVGGRIASGKTFEQMGEEMEHLFLGDAAQKTRANLLARAQISQDPDLLAIIGATDTAQAKLIFDDIAQLKERQLSAEKLFRREFGVNGMLDILILRLWNGLITAWKGVGGPDAVDRLAKAYQSQYLKSGGQGAR